jgi:hypothetical protein
MAWCPHCNQDRPIQRQTFPGRCEFCGKSGRANHDRACRGPVPGAMDVCTYCNTPVFAKALTQSEYETMADAEGKISKPMCFVVTATMDSADHPLVNDMLRFRDEVLSTNRFGRRLIDQYYVHGPRLADNISRNYYWRIFCYIFVISPAYLVVHLLFALRSLLKRIN